MKTMTLNPKKLFSGFLSLTVTVSIALPPLAFAGEMDASSLCSPYTEHTVEYGYRASVEGQPCLHVLDKTNVDTSDWNSTAIAQTATVEVCPHTILNRYSQCTTCGQTMAVKLLNGVSSTYYTDILTAWNAATGNTVTLELLQDVTVTDTLTVERASNITLTSATGRTLTSNATPAVCVKGTFTLASGTLQNKTGNCLEMDAHGAAVNVLGGALVSSDQCIRSASWESTVYISGGTLAGSTCLYVEKGAAVELSGGTFDGKLNASSFGLTIGYLLKPGYSYKKNRSWVSPNTDTLEGRVTVEQIPISVVTQPQWTNPPV